MEKIMTGFLAFGLVLGSTAGPALAQNTNANGQEPLTSLDQLPITQATPARCAVAFAIVGNWQQNGDPRGSQYPDMTTEGGQEFFVRALAGLMESHNLSREAVTAIMLAEARRLSGSDGAQKIQAMMPACLLAKQASGL